MTYLDDVRAHFQTQIPDGKFISANDRNVRPEDAFNLSRLSSTEEERSVIDNWLFEDWVISTEYRGATSDASQDADYERVVAAIREHPDIVQGTISTEFGYAEDGVNANLQVFFQTKRRVPLQPG